MRSTALGTTGATVSALCLGTDYYGSRTPVPVARRLLDEFAAAGGTFLDTANLYACFVPGFVGGESETVIGDWMADRGNRSSMFVATKVAGPYLDVPRGLRAADVRRECDKSLRRLRTEVIDLYYAHVDDRATPLAEIVEAFDSLVSAGKVRFVGASNWATWRLAEARLLSEWHRWASVAALEFRHTFLRPTLGAEFADQVAVTEELLDFARAKRLPVVAYSILLNGAYSRPDRAVPVQYRGPDSEARLAALRDVAAEVAASPSQVVIAWMLHAAQPIIPIVGGSTVDQIRENVAAASLVLSEEQVGRLDRAGALTRTDGELAEP